MDGPNHYDPNTARWTAPDPMGDAGGDKDWYGYCLDDPVNGVDPLGLAICGGACVAGAATVASVYGPSLTRAAARYGRPALNAAKTLGTSIKQTVNAYGSEISKWGGRVADEVMDGRPGVKDALERAYNRYTNHVASNIGQMKRERAEYYSRKNREEEERKAAEAKKAEEEKEAQLADARAREIADREAQRRSRERAGDFVKRAQDAIDSGEKEYGSPWEDDNDDYSPGGWHGRQAR